jgi:hypothetical protein
MGNIITGYLDSLPDKKEEDVLDNAFSELMERIRTNTESNVHHPAHYGGADSPYEAIKVIEAQGIGNEFCLGNCLKYLLRAGKKTKSPLEDYRKAKWYLERLITNIENE